MKTLISIITVFALVLVLTSCEKDFIDEPISHMELKSGKSDKLNGFDAWGFNWRAQHFNGYLLNIFFADHMFAEAPFFKKALYTGNDEFFMDVDVAVGGGQDFFDYVASNFPNYPLFFQSLLPDCKVEMHWNDDLISKDGVYPESWYDSDAWITFKYYDGQGQWSHFRKLVSVRSSYEKGEGENDVKWFDKNGIEVGLVSKNFDGLMVIQVNNSGDVNTALFYEEYTSPSGAGMGKYKIK